MLRVFLFAAALVLLDSRAHGAWVIQTVDSAGDVGRWSAIDLDAQGGPHIAYLDESNRDLKYALEQGGTWTAETVESSGLTGQQPSLAMDSQGNPHICYLDYTLRQVKHAVKQAGLWTIETIDSPSLVGGFTSIAMDAQDEPHVVYRDNGTGQMRYAHKSGGTWNIEPVPGMLAGRPSLVLDLQGNPHFAAWHSMTHEMRYATKQAGSWMVEIVTTLGANSDEGTSLRLDSQERPHISYYSSVNDSLEYASRLGGVWSVEVVDGPNVGAFASLELDSQDNPHIGYGSPGLTGTESLKYATKQNGAWSIEVVDVPGSGYSTSLALDSCGRPHISYFVIGPFDLRYAVGTCAPVVPCERTRITVQPASSSVVEGLKATFVVAATSLAPLTYQWQKDGLDLSDGGHVSGSGTPALTVDPAVMADAGSYGVVISGGPGSCGPVESDPAVLRFCARSAAPDFLQRWAGCGSAPGSLSAPGGLTVDRDGYVYVADTNNNRIQKFSSNGVLVDAWGQPGSNPEDLSTPLDVAVDDDLGILYVADSGHDRIQKFSQNGVHLGSFGSEGTADGLFNVPTAVAIDAGHNVYVTDRDNDRIQKFDSAGAWQWSLGQSGTGGVYGTTTVEFSSPQGIAVDAAGNIYVSDTGNDRIQKIGPNRLLERIWGEPGSASIRHLAGPVHLCVDRNGDVYVADRDNSAIKVFDSQGFPRTMWGTQGSAPGEFMLPAGVEVDASGQVWVADFSSCYVQKFGCICQEVFVRTDFQDARSINDVALADLNRDGHPDVVSADYLFGSVSVWMGNSSGAFQFESHIATGSGPATVIAADLDGDGLVDLASTNYDGDTISILTGDGEGGLGKPFSYPVGPGPYGLAAGDVDGDQRPDLVIARREVSGGVLTVLQAAESGGYLTPVDIPVNGQLREVVLADVDRDGLLDCVLSEEDLNVVAVFRGTGAGKFGPIEEYATAVGPQVIAVGDLNGDGYPDIAAGCYQDAAVTVLMNDRSGTFQSVGNHELVTAAAGVEIADINGDGRPDVIASNYLSAQVSVFLGNGDGTLRPKTDYDVGESPGAVVAGFLNEDGLPDLVVGNYRDSFISVLLNGTPFICGEPWAVDVRAQPLRNSTRILGTPNPFRSSTSFSLTLARALDLRVAIYDVSGRRVRELVAGKVAAGPHVFHWDGRDAVGQPAAGGIYLARARGRDLDLRAKLVKLE